MGNWDGKYTKDQIEIERQVREDVKVKNEDKARDGLQDIITLQVEAIDKLQRALKASGVQECTCHGTKEYTSAHPEAHEWSASCTCCRDRCDGTGFLLNT